eukprot:TRINITY_DN2254_c0_g1_i1.p6 TRINITY_DN2254_c0_g1~~TRINITY_DN2254_c0_g1_i1.p6  ORF type:complete len:182 (-),score=24.03 TRINITY_DN2254_c0_g1_i1:2597-3100(-)
MIPCSRIEQNNQTSSEYNPQNVEEDNSNRTSIGSSVYGNGNGNGNGHSGSNGNSSNGNGNGNGNSSNGNGNGNGSSYTNGNGNGNSNGSTVHGDGNGNGNGNLNGMTMVSSQVGNIAEQISLNNMSVPFSASQTGEDQSQKAYGPQLAQQSSLWGGQQSTWGGLTLG